MKLRGKTGAGLFVLLATLDAGAQASSGGGSSIGPSVCEGAGSAICWSDVLVGEAQLPDLAVCPLAHSTMVSVTDRSTGEMSDYSFPTEYVAVAPGVLGAGRTYRGTQVSLHINTDVPELVNGFPAVVSVESLGVIERNVYCELIDRSQAK